ncbi:E3 SUMO-protein ligase ZBED1-like [Patiria miniata]|uniref:HAT C-terminal dimerisation domain-containing protein n=1 Tax=Patiria miniata TaxID=46514 RepID=A0A914BNW6_PATMI|nr:E3 SUMO-protein ligase ZBED1-like [Patiria miniata]
MGELVKCLKPLQVATTVLSAEKNVSASIVHPIIRGLVRNHMEPLEADSAPITEFKIVVARDLEHRFCSEGAKEPPAKKTKEASGKDFLLGTSGASEKSNVDVAAVAQSEFDMYMRSPPLDNETDPMNWWRDNSKLFPTLSRLAQKFLAIPATSVPSAAGNIVNSKRSLLLPENVNRCSLTR